MNDQEQPKPSEQPVVPEIVTPVEASNDKPEFVKLETLPPAVRDVLDSMITAGFGSHKVKSELEKKFSPLGDILPASRGTYERYIEKYYDQLSSKKQIESEFLDSLKEDKTAVEGFVDTALKGNKLSKVEEIENLKRFIINRIALIEKSQSSGTPDARLENTLSTYINGLRTLLEKTIEYGEELNKDTANALRSYLLATFDEWMGASITAYKKVNGNEKLVEFSTELSSSLKEIVTAQLLEIETENDGKNKQNNN